MDHTVRITSLKEPSRYSFRIDCPCGRQTFVQTAAQLKREVYAHTGLRRISR